MTKRSGNLEVKAAVHNSSSQPGQPLAPLAWSFLFTPLLTSSLPPNASATAFTRPFSPYPRLLAYPSCRPVAFVGSLLARRVSPLSAVSRPLRHSVRAVGEEAAQPLNSEVRRRTVSSVAR